MPKDWYESDDDEWVWWKATKKNKNRICPNWFETAIGLGTGSISLATEAKRNIGARMPLSVIWGAGNKSEHGLIANLAGVALCSGAYVGGGLDSFYQVNHNGYHLGTAILDEVGECWEETVSWYHSSEKGVENFLTKTYEWWKS